MTSSARLRTGRNMGICWHQVVHLQRQRAPKPPPAHWFERGARQQPKLVLTTIRLPKYKGTHFDVLLLIKQNSMRCRPTYKIFNKVGKIKETTKTICWSTMRMYLSHQAFAGKAGYTSTVYSKLLQY